MTQLLRSVRGFLQRYNDLLVAPAIRQSGHRTHVVFFPGDIMTLKADMPDYKAYSLEEVTEKMQRKFPESWVYVVRASRLQQGGLACFENFEREATLHLAALLKEVGVGEGERMRLVGFSKGCLVVNQLLAEVASTEEGRYLHWESEEAVEIERRKYTPGYRPVAKDTMTQAEQDAVVAFFSRVDSVMLLDGHRFITSASVARALARYLDRRLELTVSTHGTPRQLQDAGRPEIGEHHQQFLSHMGPGRVQHRFYFGGERSSLAQHFRILDAFEVL